MSKSKKNVVDLDDIVDSYGADTARLYLLSDSPPERDLEWTEAGIDGAWRYVSRLWRLVSEPAVALPPAGQRDAAGLVAGLVALRRTIHKTIAAVTDDLEKFRFNRAVARIRELTNALEDIPAAEPGAGAVLREGLEVVTAAGRADDAAPRRGNVADARPCDADRRRRVAEARPGAGARRAGDARGAGQRQIARHRRIAARRRRTATPRKRRWRCRRWRSCSTAGRRERSSSCRTGSSAWLPERERAYQSGAGAKAPLPRRGRGWLVPSGASRVRVVPQSPSPRPSPLMGELTIL